MLANDQLITFFVCVCIAGAINAATGAMATIAQPQVLQQPIQPPEPLFAAVPPRPQKLLHSEAYIRYTLYPQTYLLRDLNLSVF